MSPTNKPQLGAARKNRPLPPEYVVIATHLADSHTLDPNSPELKPAISQVLAEFKGALVDLKAINSADAEITNVAMDACHAAEFTMNALERIAASPRPPGAGQMFFEGLLHGAVGDFYGGVKRANEVDDQVKAIQEEVLHIVTGLRQLQTAKLQLPRLAKKYGGPTVVRGQAILIDFDEAWGPYGPKSLISLVNNFSDLHNCTILIEIQGSTEVVQNVHFVADWKSNSPIYARYSPGTELPDDTLEKQIVPEVQRLVASIWADELSQESIRFDYAGEEKGKDVSRYCKTMTVIPEYRPFQKGLISNTNRGLHLQLDGIAFIEPSRVTANFRRGEEIKSLYWDLERWQGGERKTLDTGGNLSWDPDEITVEVCFPNILYKHSGSWTNPK